MGITKYWIATSASTWATNASWSSSPSVYVATTAPAADDDAVFSSGYSGNCSVNAAATCRSLVMTTYTGIFAGSSGSMIITGSDSSGNTLVLNTAGSFTYSGTITFNNNNGSSGNITSNGKTISGTLTFNLNDNQTATFTDNFTSGTTPSGSITVNSGNVTCTSTASIRARSITNNGTGNITFAGTSVYSYVNSAASVQTSSSTGLNRVMTSSTGASWSTATGSVANTWTSIAYGEPGGNPTFVAISDDTSSVSGNLIMTSSDGINWTTRSSPQDNPWCSVTYGNGLFVAVSINGTNRVMTSPDGVTWTLRNAASASRWRSVTYGGGVYVAVADSFTAGASRVMTSTDGITWTSRTAASNNNWVSVTYGTPSGSGLFVAVSDNYESSAYRVMTSPDGVNWTSRTAATSTVETSSVDSNWKSVTYGGGVFVAVASVGLNAASRVMTSTDGINWTLRTAAAEIGWNSVTYGGGTFVAVAGTGSGSGVMTSTDGITWTSRTASSDINWTSVTYGNGKFVAVSYTGNGGNIIIGSPTVSTTLQCYSITAMYGSIIMYGTFTASVISSEQYGKIISNGASNTNTTGNINIGGGGTITINGNIAGTDLADYLIQGGSFKLGGNLTKPGSYSIATLTINSPDASFITTAGKTFTMYNNGSASYYTSLSNNVVMSFNANYIGPKITMTSGALVFNGTCNTQGSSTFDAAAVAAFNGTLAAGNITLTGGSAVFAYQNITVDDGSVWSVTDSTFDIKESVLRSGTYGLYRITISGSTSQLKTYVGKSFLMMRNTGKTNYYFRLTSGASVTLNANFSGSSFDVQAGTSLDCYGTVVINDIDVAAAASPLAAGVLTLRETVTMDNLITAGTFTAYKNITFSDSGVCSVTAGTCDIKESVLRGGTYGLYTITISGGTFTTYTTKSFLMMRNSGKTIYYFRLTSGASVTLNANFNGSSFDVQAGTSLTCNGTVLINDIDVAGTLIVNNTVDVTTVNNTNIFTIGASTGSVTATGTLTSSAGTFTAIGAFSGSIVNITGGTFTIDTSASAFTTSGAMTLSPTASAVTLNIKRNITLNRFISTDTTNARAITIDSGVTVTLTSAPTISTSYTTATWDVSNHSGLTLSALGSTLKFTGTGSATTSPSFRGSLNVVGTLPGTSFTYANSNVNYGTIWFNRNNSGATGANTIYGSNFFERIIDGQPDYNSNPTEYASIPAHGLWFEVGKAQVTKSFTVSGRTGAKITLNSTTTSGATTASPHYLHKVSGTGIVNAYNVDVTNSYATTASTWYSIFGTSVSGNTNWSFAGTLYWVGRTNGNWNVANNWSATSGGTGNTGSPSTTPTSATPVIFNNAALSGGGTMTKAVIININATCGGLDSSAATLANGFSFSNDTGNFGTYNLTINGNAVLSNAFNSYATTASTYIEIKADGQTFSLNPGTINANVVLNAPNGGSILLSGNFFSGAYVKLLAGTFNTSPNSGTTSYNLTCGYFDAGASATAAASVILNASTVTLSTFNSANLRAWDLANANTTTLNAGTSTIVLSDIGSGGFIFNATGNTYYNLSLTRGSSTGSVTIAGSNTFSNIFTDTGTGAHTIKFESGSTNTFKTFTVNGSSAANSITLDTTTGGGANYTFVSTNSAKTITNNLIVNRSTGTPTLKWYIKSGTIGTNTTGWYRSGSKLLALLGVG